MCPSNLITKENNSSIQMARRRGTRYTHLLALSRLSKEPLPNQASLNHLLTESSHRNHRSNIRNKALEIFWKIEKIKNLKKPMSLLRPTLMNLLEMRPLISMTIQDGTIQQRIILAIMRAETDTTKTAWLSHNEIALTIEASISITIEIITIMLRTCPRGPEAASARTRR